MSLAGVVERYAELWGAVIVQATRDARKAAREIEGDAFANAVHDLRVPLAKALCDGHDTEKHIRAKSGLWSEFDAALVRELQRLGNALQDRHEAVQGVLALDLAPLQDEVVQHLAQRAATHQLHGEVGAAIRGDADVVDRRDARMLGHGCT